MDIKISDVIVSFLHDKNINTVFGIIGSANSHIYDSCVKSGITIINTHNEQAALLAAGGYYRTSGKLAVALVTAGGGVSKSITGVVSVWADSIPAIIISGQEKLEYVKNHTNRRMYGTQGLDIVHMVSKTTKYAKLVDSDRIQDELENAYKISLQDRKGPVWLDIPFDIQSKRIIQREWNSTNFEIFEPSDKDMKNVYNLIENAKRPVILGGHGIKLSKCIDLFKSCIEKLNIPVLLTWSAIDILDHGHKLFFGSPGIYGQRSSNFIFQKCDLLITIGSRMTIPQTGYDLNEVARNAKIVMVDVDETEFKEFVDFPIKANCESFIKRMFVVDKVFNNESINECINIRREFPIVDNYHVDDVFPNSYKLIDRISDYLKTDQIIVTDMGTALLSGHQSIRLKDDMTMFSSYGLGEMGYGLPGALGAAIAGNGREVLCLNCDGGMMMNIQELQTIIQHNLPIKIVIFNNDGYLMIKHTQKMLFNGNYSAVDKNTGIVLPDYIKVATAFGYENFRIKTWSEFDFYFPRFMNHKGPSICEIYMPSEQEFIPKVKGVVKNDGCVFAPPLEEMSPILQMNDIKRIMKNDISKKSQLIIRPSEKQ